MIVSLSFLSGLFNRDPSGNLDSSRNLHAMGVFILLVLILAFTGRTNRAEEARQDDDPMMLFDFSSANEASWQIVNDGVMGGRSQGFVVIEQGVLRFTGTLVTQGGGFTSVRADFSIDLSDYAGLELRVRGSGRTFAVALDDGTRLRGRTVSRRAPLQTQADWTVVRVPFSALRTSVFGRPVDVAPIDLTHVMRIGLYILDGKDGPFRLEVDEIRAYRQDTAY